MVINLVGRNVSAGVDVVPRPLFLFLKWICQDWEGCLPRFAGCETRRFDVLKFPGRGA